MGLKKYSSDQTPNVHFSRCDDISYRSIQHFFCYEFLYKGRIEGHLDLLGYSGEMKMMIREMTIEDYDAVHDLWRMSNIRNEPEDERAAVERFLRGDCSTGIVAIAHDLVVGGAICGSDGRYGYIHHLAVHPDHRRQGIGRALTTAAVEFLQLKQNVLNIIVMVWAHNNAGTAFWKRCGFSIHTGLAVLSFPSG